MIQAHSGSMPGFHLFILGNEGCVGRSEEERGQRPSAVPVLSKVGVSEPSP